MRLKTSGFVERLVDNLTHARCWYAIFWLKKISTNIIPSSIVFARLGLIFFLFPKLKLLLRGKRFESIE